MYRASRVERSLRSVPPRVSNFFLSVSRSTVPANAKADLSRRAFLRVEEAMRNWPRPMKIRTIRLYVTRERCIFHLVSLSLSLFPFPLFLRFSQDEMDLNERDRAAQLRYLSRRFLVRIATIDLYFSANLSLPLPLSFSPSFVSAQTGRESGETEADSLGQKNRDVSSHVASNDRSFPRADLNGRARWKKTWA